MGLARLREINSAAADLTASGITLGTFDYISPEQARDPRNADVRSDLYSLGCTFFYMLTGRPPFPGGTVLQKLLQHQGDQPPDVRQFRPELPEGVARVLRRTLAKEPRHRYADPAEMVTDLLVLAHEAGIHPGMAGRKSWMAEERPAAALVRRHLPWAAPLAAFLLMVLLLNRVWAPVASQEVLPPPLGQGDRPAAMSPEKGGPAARSRKGEAPPVRAEEPGKQPAGENSPPALAADGEEAPLPPEGRPAAGPLDQPGLPAGEPADDPGQVNTWGHLTPGVVQLPLGDSGGLTGPATSLPRLSDADGGPLGVGSGPGMGLSGTGTLAEASSNHSGTADRGPPGRRGRVLLAGRGLWRGGQRQRDRVALRRPARGTAPPPGQPPRDHPRRRRLSAGDRLPAHRARSREVPPQHGDGRRRTADADRGGDRVAGSAGGAGRPVVAAGDAGRRGGVAEEMRAGDRQCLRAIGHLSAGRGLRSHAGGAGGRHGAGRRHGRADPAGEDRIGRLHRRRERPSSSASKTSSRSTSPGTTACWPPPSGCSRPAAARGRRKPARKSRSI